MRANPGPHRPGPARRRVANSLVAGLLGGLLVAMPAPAAVAADVTDGLVLRYDLTQTSGTAVEDTSGHGNHGTVNGGGTWTGPSGLLLDGVDDHVHLPNNLLAGLSAVTVSVDVFVDPTQATPFFIWGLGNPSTSGSGTGYLFTSGNAFRAGITTTNWAGEKVTAKSPGGDLARGVWKTVTYTQVGTVGTLYEDGAQVGQNTAVTVLPSEVGNGTTTTNNLGRSTYASDRLLKGSVMNFRIYDRALTPDEVAAISLTDSARVAADAEGLALGDLSAVTDDLTLPVAGAFGSTISWASSDPAVISTTGQVTRPSAVSGAATVTVTATVSRGTSSEARTFEATVLPDADDQAKADEAAAALALVNPDDVRGHLAIPTTGLHGATVTWTSSAPEVVAADGIVDRPTNGSGDTSVTMTADVVVGQAHASRSIVLTVRELPAPAPYTGYAFSYFTSSSIAGEKIYFAASQGNNALQWTELNGGQPVLESTYGTLGLRDPFLIRSPEGDKFFLIATDLSIGRNSNWDQAQRQGSLYLEIWESTDLVTWSEQRHVKISPDTAGNTWAPEAYWDETLQQYVVFWASKLYAESDPGHTGSTYNRMLYATTRDFVTFSEPQIWQDRGESRIDSTVIREGGTFYRFTKDEGGGGTGCSDIIQEKSPSLTAVDLPGQPAWTMLDSCIGRDAGTSAVEGPTVFKANPGDTSGSQYYLFVDEYGGRGYIPLGTDDLEHPNWQVPGSYRLPASPRHGTVIPVTAAELDALHDAPDPLPSTADGLVAHYPLNQTTGSTVADASGNGNTATLAGDATWNNGSLLLGGTNGHVKLPDNLMAGMEEISVSLDVNIAATQANPYFIWGFGNTSGTSGNGYLFTTGNTAYRTSIASGNWSTEQTVSSGSALPRDVWKTLTYTLDATGTARLYLDGMQVGSKTGVTLRPGDIGGGATLANYIGRSVYPGDRYLKGQVRDVFVYNRALEPSEVASLGTNATAVTGVTLAALKVPAIIHGATSTITLPVTPGTDLTALDPAYATGAGSTVTPTGPQDYSSPVQVTVTAASGATRTWTVKAVEMRSPALPGLNADPNIVRFGDTYYIYATTDGFAGWGSTSFKVWSSTDLAAWTEHDTILDLGPDVTWADARAWAPTATEKDGTYYFYFSADQNIGVAVSDSPLGPFTEPLGKPLISKADYGNAQQIDPAVFTDDDGTSWLLWGNGTPRMAKLNADMTSIDKATEITLPGLTGFREGLFLNKRNGTYYLSWSIDDTGSENYRVGYATASSPTGPYSSKGEILTKDVSQGILGTGHHSILQVPGTDDWYIAYHRFAIPGGNGFHRETTIDRLHFTADGAIQKVVPTLSGVDPLTYDGPTPEATISDAGSDGWYAAEATLSLTAGEGVERLQYRLDGQAWTDYSAPVALPAGTYDVDYRAQGANLQWSAVSTVHVKVDGTPPGLSWSGEIAEGASFIFGSVPAAPSCTAEDADSGPVGCTVTGYSTDVGAHTLTATATDVAGNQTVTRVHYTVTAWSLRGFYQPVNMGGVLNTVKAGRIVPLQFQAFAGTTELTSPTDVKGLTTTSISCTSGAAEDAIETVASGGTGLRYEDGSFIYNWRTPQRRDTCLRVTITTQDGSTLSALFKLT